MADDDLATLDPHRARTTARPADGAGPPQPGPAERRSRDRPAGRWLPRIVIVGLVLAALNLRPAITSLGALLEEVRDGLGMSGTVAGLLTSVPALCFAVFGVAAPRLARRFGPGAVVCAGMAAIAAGLALRPFAGGTGGFLAASALALAGHRGQQRPDAGDRQALVPRPGRLDDRPLLHGAGPRHRARRGRSPSP